MIIIFASLFISLLFCFSLYFFLSFWISVLLGILVFLALYFFTSKWIGLKVSSDMLGVQKSIKRKRFDLAVNLLIFMKEKYSYWQLFFCGSIDGHIGSIYYFQRKFVKAKPFLEKSFVKHWSAKAMLAIIYFRDNSFINMDRVFESAVKYSPKESLLWSMWAFCYHKKGYNEKAIYILVRGKNIIGGQDQRLLRNIINLKNDRKMKMKFYGDLWFQFQLETSNSPKFFRSRMARHRK